MSCVAELNASSHRNASVYWKNGSVGMVRATPASPAPTSSCIDTIHSRRVLRMSTSGLHSGLITHGR
jgi:hypothetical protein